jgi:hypothetical protein
MDNLNLKILRNLDGVIEFNIPDWMYAEAISRSNQLKILNNSITNGEGNVAGYIGQQAFVQLFDGKDVDTFDYDILHPELGRVEVKTKRQNVNYVNLNFEGSIADYNPNQNYDYVAFFRVNIDQKKGWFCGFTSKEGFDMLSRKMCKGKTDTESSNNFEVKADCRNIYYNQLSRKVKIA